eukprot:m.362693 g.362693  ORF g.362693 m.362693 type:complete len:351 (-) comp19961_c1_seq19:1809-2861(-)
MPANDPAVVTALCEWLGWDPSQLVTVTKQPQRGLPVPPEFSHPDGSPRTLSVRAFMTHYLDVSGVPHRYFFEVLSHFARSEQEAERLKEFDTAEGQEDLYDYSYRPRRTYLETFQDFVSTRGAVPLEYAFDLFLPLRPRAFSISSSLKAHPGQVHLTVALVKYKTLMAKPRVGVCSTWLSDLAPGSKVRVWVGRGTFLFPRPSVPVVFIGPGTGVAPFRSAIQERLAAPTSATTLFFFGCRNEARDFLYRDEWAAAGGLGRLTVVTAFSRDQEDKVYVQHRLREHGAAVWDVMENGGYCYLAGNAKRMPIDVREALEWIATEHGHLSQEEAGQFWTRMEQQRRFQSETWS